MCINEPREISKCCFFGAKIKKVAYSEFEINFYSLLIKFYLISQFLQKKALLTDDFVLTVTRLNRSSHDGLL